MRKALLHVSLRSRFKEKTCSKSKCYSDLCASEKTRNRPRPSSQPLVIPCVYRQHPLTGTKVALRARRLSMFPVGSRKPQGEAHAEKNRNCSRDGAHGRSGLWRRT
ncbi:hypothetical protein SF83666_b50830 (plasmid) [Sinorhizobium fredii CCBAU 83666]|nr:hypothetical protein SF83666_b50830 [Sinorhizobium fredii CCBAU 83666]